MTTDTTLATVVSKISSVVNRGAVTKSITTSGGSYTIPAGYHNGSGKVTGPTLASLVGTNVTLASNTNLLKDVTAYGKNGTRYVGTHVCKTLAQLVGTSATLASNANLLTGFTAYGKNGTKYTGSNKGYSAGVSDGRAQVAVFGSGAYEQNYGRTATLSFTAVRSANGIMVSSGSIKFGSALTGVILVYFLSSSHSGENHSTTVKIMLNGTVKVNQTFVASGHKGGTVNLGSVAANSTVTCEVTTGGISSGNYPSGIVTIAIC